MEFPRLFVFILLPGLNRKNNNQTNNKTDEKYKEKAKYTERKSRKTKAKENKSKIKRTQKGLSNFCLPDSLPPFFNVRTFIILAWENLKKGCGCFNVLYNIYHKVLLFFHLKQRLIFLNSYIFLYRSGVQISISSDFPYLFWK